jgi:hypothetical protein
LLLVEKIRHLAELLGDRLVGRWDCHTNNTCGTIASPI